MAEKSVRKSNIELLRIIAICGVIVLHYNNRLYGNAFELVPQGSINEWILYLLEAVFISSVNLFILISGYFMIDTPKRDLSKPISLILQVIICNLAVYFIRVGLGEYEFSVKGLIGNFLPVNYFVIQYAALFLISPFINKAMLAFEKDELKKIVIVIFGVLSVWPQLVDVLQKLLNAEFAGLSSIGAYGSQSGYTLINFILMYIIGAYLKITSPKVSLRSSVLLLMVLIMAVTLWSRFEADTALSYCNPLIVMEAAALFIVVMKFDFSSIIINNLSKACFMCFLIHINLIRFLDVNKAVNSNVIFMLMHILFSCVGLFLVSYLVNAIYSFMMNPILRQLKGKLII